ncbi:MAG TPA: thioredoxin family protein [Ktedonobacteraceae bacterium]|nr:thioredoxin family protein [Ktedonobacteraceae bacterium]
MTAFLVRLLVLALASVLLYLLVWSGRRFVETRRQQALAAAPLAVLATVGNTNNSLLPVDVASTMPVRILAFSSADCHQCHQLQAPALQRVQETRGDSVSVLEIDAPSSPELTRRYHVLTVPSTVILDASGHARGVNYGFANTRRLLEQVDEVLAKG